jgi:hypothetical protein
VIDFGQNLIARHEDTVKFQAPNGMRREQLEGRPLQPPGVAIDDEGRDAARSVPLRRAGKHGVDVGVGRIGYKNLRAGKPEAPAVALGPHR